MLQFVFKALVYISLLGCVMTAKKLEPQPTPVKVEQEFGAITKAFAKNPSPKNIAKLEQIAQQYPDLEISTEANALLGEFFYKQQNWSKTISAYQQILQSPYYSNKESMARLRVAQSLWQQKDSFRAAEFLGPLLQESPPQNILRLAHELQIEIQLFKGNRVLALESMLVLAQMGAQEQNDYSLRAKQLVQFEMSREELGQIAGKRNYRLVQSLALFRLGLGFFEEGEYSRAESYLSDVIRLEPQSALAEQSEYLVKQIRARSKIQSKTIGVILPLSGKLASIGYKSLSGIEHALGIFSGNSEFKLAVIDSEAKPTTAQRAVERLVLEDNVIAIVGSVKATTSLAIAKKCQELGVPNIGFSLSSEISNTGEYVFRNALTAQMQVRTLVETSMRKYGFKRFAILYPNDNYGVEFANIFWDEVLARGGEIRGAQTYKPNETDFRDPIRRLVGTYYREDRMDEYRLRLQDWQAKWGENSRKKIPEDLLPPIVDFDAIFIPDTSKALGQIAPMLIYNDIQQPHLIGTNLWNTPSIGKRAGQFKDRLVFVDGYTDYSKPEAQEFTSSFEKNYGRKPENYESIAFETALLLRQLIEKEGIRTRSDLRKALESLRSYPSPLGLLTVNELGDIERPLRALTFESGNIQRIE